jgi:hypothetical protein
MEDQVIGLIQASKRQYRYGLLRTASGLARLFQDTNNNFIDTKMFLHAATINVVSTATPLDQVSTARG